MSTVKCSHRFFKEITDLHWLNNILLNQSINQSINWLIYQSFLNTYVTFQFCSNQSKPFPSPLTIALTHCGLVTPWQHRSGSTWAKVMVCCLTAPSHYLTQCSLIIIGVACIWEQFHRKCPRIQSVTWFRKSHFKNDCNMSQGPMINQCWQWSSMPHGVIYTGPQSVMELCQHIDVFNILHKSMTNTKMLSIYHIP